jgi:type VI secretion system protein ImpB
MELPFVAGILADLSGNVDDPNRVPMRERKYVEIDRDNFNDIMKSIGPKVAVNGGSTVLKFDSLDDFSPISVLSQLELKERFDKRTRLSDAIAKLDGNVKLQQKFVEVLRDETKRKEMKAKVDELKAMLTEKTAEQPKAEESPETPKEPEGGKKK